MTYPLLFLFALAPSFIWLAFYLRKDAHPEPNRMILKIFLLGMLATIPAIYAETFLEGLFSALPLPPIGFLALYFLAGIALVEEVLKYAVVRLGALRNSALDEPLDIMLYMVIAALGFAALENIFLLFKLAPVYPASDIFFINAVRFLQAIFLHALASGIFGYFFALSLVRKKKRKTLFSTGLLASVALHGLFNLYIFTVGEQSPAFLFLPTIPLLFFALLVSLAFRQLKKAGLAYPA
jgi:protease PrsW